jgi:hypothetical protein
LRRVIGRDTRRLCVLNPRHRMSLWCCSNQRTASWLILGPLIRSSAHFFLFPPSERMCGSWSRVDAFLQSRAESRQSREAAIAEFVRNAAYTWANRLLALRCMETRSLIDEVILQKDAYGGRSLQHNRLANKPPVQRSG